VSGPLLRELGLPEHGAASSKHERGQVLVVGGSRQTPGAVLLAGVGALRVGGGSLQLATVASATAALAMAVPEAAVVGLAETTDGAIDGAAAAELAAWVPAADAVLVGSGVLEDRHVAVLLRTVVAGLDPAAVLVVDAGGLRALVHEPGLLEPVAGRTVVMPNPAEMAAMLAWSLDDVLGDPQRAVEEATARLGVVVALRGAETWVSAPGGVLHRDRSGHVGLGTSGSGDVLAGALVGLAARGAEPLRATLWAVHLHATAGERLAGRGPGLGLLARELLDELPYALRALS
jgi:hydroxyethylthiazole kinase-like uncharacterized protein yjeF